ncbi:MAG TPA: lipase family protein [Kofleriaceae bacterium]
MNAKARLATTTSAYDPVMASVLVSAVNQAYLAYQNPGYTIDLPGYTVLASIYVYQLGQQVFFGYTATGAPSTGAAPNNIVVLRGTQGDFEALYDLDWSGTTCNLNGIDWGTVAAGQFDFYTQYLPILEKSLSRSVLDGVAQFTDTSLPLYVCGHSLGGGIATLASLDIVANDAYPTAPTMYTYGGLHVGQQDFVDFFSFEIPSAYRVINLADFVPTFTGVTDDTDYVHVGQEWSFLWHNEYLWANHSCTDVYLATLQQNPQVVLNVTRNYPNAGQP